MGSVCAVLFCSSAALSQPSERPNVLMIAVDDLNDWIGCLGGHPQAKTPNIDRLARRGVLFTNAQCQSPVCNPSRASLMTGRYPESTGIYFLDPPIGDSPVAREATQLPQRFLQEGYYVTAAGKLYHGDENVRYLPNYAGNFGAFGPYPDKKLTGFPGHMLWDWGAYPERDDQTPDYQIATWAENQLAKNYDQPLWLGIGFYRPHVPQYAPQKWFDLYPLETLRLPAVVANDLDDVPEYGVNLTRLKHVSPTMEWVEENNEWKPLVRSYLACVSFVDHQIGRVLDALEKSGRSENTVVVLYGDHGFHLGEKRRFAKRSIWRDGAGVPLIIAGPGVAKGAVCDHPVQLLDIYPTLLALTGLDADSGLQGHSLKPLLDNPKTDWPYMARSSFGPENVAIVSDQYRYIHYHDGSEELYDRKKDPNEWMNLASDPAYRTIIEEYREKLPKSYYPLLGSGSTGHDAFEATEKIANEK
ncbi:sulfatase-like hydrolase/transferase [Tichowtungia aerotolerans]|uniref:Sulfatase-like hydrolase/transferase n=2 Tax=Tichowtungia aerotolerans TaxID=2697043 RepID=A0A6P1MG28_9BACT|nr:sulfatase-like hydrolase/transferase [Tichowtungia aerotolerans]